MPKKTSDEMTASDVLASLGTDLAEGELGAPATDGQAGKGSGKTG
jgi:hypothetical protein